MSKKSRLTESLILGNTFTAKQIKSKFGLANPTATISAIRFSGYAVYANKVVNKDGSASTVYRYGNPPRRVIAAGFRALANSNKARG